MRKVENRCCNGWYKTRVDWAGSRWYPQAISVGLGEWRAVWRYQGTQDKDRVWRCRERIQFDISQIWLGSRIVCAVGLVGKEEGWLGARARALNKELLKIDLWVSLRHCAISLLLQSTLLVETDTSILVWRSSYTQGETRESVQSKLSWRPVYPPNKF